MNSLNKVEKNVPLARLNTFGSACNAKYYIAINHIESLQAQLLRVYKKNMPLLILGAGSNILFTRDFDGLVLQMKTRSISLIREDKYNVWLKVDAGVLWHKLVLYCIDKGYGGLENLSLIPGTVGAAPVQNIGAYGVEVCKFIEEVHTMEIENGHYQILKKDDCRFDYRNSLFKREKKYLILSVVFKLDKCPKVNTTYGDIQKILSDRKNLNPTIRDVSDIIVQIRTSKLTDPNLIGNAGSFFKNPVISLDKFEFLKAIDGQIPGYIVSNNSSVKLSAAWLIENCGWRGRRIGDVGVSPSHALILVRYPAGTGAQVYDLYRAIQNSVYDKWGIKLEAEVEIL
jgi:UDP-N-acetylmuramate dehydrogenase